VLLLVELGNNLIKLGMQGDKVICGALGDVWGCFGRFVKINFSLLSSQLAPLFFPMLFDYKWP